MSERPPVLDYASPWRKSLRTAWWLLLSGLAFVVAVGMLVLAIL